MTLLVRAASLNRFADVALAAGLDPHALLREVGLPVRALQDPDMMVSTRAVSTLLELAAERARDRCFGLRMAESRRISNLGPLALVIRDAPTLREVLEMQLKHFHLHNEALAYRVETASDQVILSIDVINETGRPVPQSIELVMAVSFRTIAFFFGAGWTVRRVCFAHQAPADKTLHRATFGPALEFGADANCLVFPASDLDRPNPGADPVLARYTHELLGPGAKARQRFSDQVRQQIVLLLPRGLCDAVRVAQQLGVQRRTLVRRLHAEGTGFRELVHAVRRDLVLRYLAEPDRSLASISDQLGFAAPSALSRWHRETFGSAARDARRLARR